MLDILAPLLQCIHQPGVPAALKVIRIASELVI